MTMIINNTANNPGVGVFAQRSNILLYNDIQIMNKDQGGGMFIRDELYDISACNDVNVVTNCPFKINNTDIKMGFTRQHCFSHRFRHFWWRLKEMP